MKDYSKSQDRGSRILGMIIGRGRVDAAADGGWGISRGKVERG